MTLIVGDAVDYLSLVRPSGAACFDADGLLQIAAPNVLRFDHDPVTKAVRGALLEDTATNLFDASDWTDAATTYGTVMPAQAAGPDGTDTLALITSTALNGGVAKTVSVPAGDGLTRTASLHFRKGTADTHRLDIGYFGGPAPYRSASTYFDGATGEVSGDGGVIDCGGGLYRLWVALDNEVADEHNVCQIVSNVIGASGSTAYTGDLQIELGSYPTSCVKTTDGAATRAADVASLSVAGMSLDKGFIAFEALAAPGSSVLMMANLDGGSINENGAFRFSVDGEGEYFYTATPEGTEKSLRRLGAGLDLTAPVRAAFTWDGDTIWSTVNGLEPVSDTISTAAGSFDFARLLLGRGSWVTNSACWMKRVLLLPRRATTDEMKAVFAS
ncbi:hypothetical protein [Mesorhizobium sp. 1M-11]|uniref:phage head spike fiber domain-containing protein n=1 Tax=Mesorhizobium sp. 1M-11 TaxID=1529006 RepID=UPI0006C749D5|nr:hypothetical protein [Mesorhizobium sp. 1M-11]